MKVKIDLEKNEHPSMLKLADAIICFLSKDYDSVQELFEYLLTWIKHNKDESEVM